MIDTNEVAQRFGGRLDVRSGVVRRRHWNEQEKGRIVAEAVTPGAVVAQVARRHEMTPQHLSNWIRAAKRGRIALPEETAVAFVPVVGEHSQAAPRSVGHVEIAAGAMVVRVPLHADPRTLEVILRTLRQA